jgi:hypothetical protein
MTPNHFYKPDAPFLYCFLEVHQVIIEGNDTGSILTYYLLGRQLPQSQEDYCRILAASNSRPNICCAGREIERRHAIPDASL